MVFKNKEYKEVLIFYNKVIIMVKGYKNLICEVVVVLINWFIVYILLYSVIEVLRDVEEVVRFD